MSSNNNVSNSERESMSERMSVSNSSEWEPLKDFENDYEVETEPPHRIRKISSGWIVTTTLNNRSGYIDIRLNGKTYLYHRILAKQFIPNPDDLPEIDHINQIKTDNRLDNLRWVDRSKNLKNRVKYVKQKSEFLDHAPDDIIRITEFNGVEYQPYKYYFCFKNNRVIQRVNGFKWQWLAQTPHQGYVRVIMRDINGRYHQVYMHKLIKHFSWRQGNKPARARKYTVGDLEKLNNPENLNRTQYYVWRRIHIEMSKDIDVDWL